MALKLNLEGLGPLDYARGIAAAEKVFNQAGVTPQQAAVARFKRDRPDYPELTDSESRAAIAWDEADAAAARAACEHWADPPTSVDLSVV